MIATPALLPHAERELARRDFRAFVQRMAPQIEMAPHVELICDRLQALADGTITRLCVEVPPQHGKSTLCSQLWPAFYLGRNPDNAVVLASYGQELSNRNSRIVRAYLGADRYPSDLSVSGESSAADRWNIEGHRGGLRAASISSGLSGWTSHAMVLDDLIASVDDARSPAISEMTWNFWTDVASTRLARDYRMLLVGTRWLFGDIMSRIAESDPGLWEILRLPALSLGEDVDPLKRPAGRALWPAFKDEAALEEQRRTMGTARFNALYQCDPAPDGGNLFSSAMLSHSYERLPEEKQFAPLGEWEVARLRAAQRHGGGLDPFDRMWARARSSRPLLRVMGADLASMTGVSHDFSALVTIVFDGQNYYIADVARQKLEFVDLLRLVRDTFDKNRPSRIFIENASSGIAVQQALRSWTQLPVIPVSARGSKISRAEAMTPLFEIGRVLLPKQAPWLQAYVDEFLRFNGGGTGHDDMVDATMLALSGASEIVNRQRDAAQNAAAYANGMQR